jgi:hypothetical protein
MATSSAARDCDALEHIGAHDQLRATVWTVRNAADSMHA